MSHCTMVAQFTKKHTPGLPNAPIKMDSDAIQFIENMVCSELEELSEGKTVVDQADALVDILYYIHDCAVRHGINLDPIFRIVHEANMAKIKDGVVKDENGKVQKPEGWAEAYAPEPRIDHEIRNQTVDGAF